MPQILLEEERDIGKVNGNSWIVIVLRLMPHQRLVCGVSHAVKGY
jgi:hypothetical protein